MTIHELERYLSNSSNNPLLSLQSSGNLIPEKLEICEHVLPDGKMVELTLDRQRSKMILEVYRNGDLVGEPINFFFPAVTNAILGKDWIDLKPLDIILRVLECEESLKTA